MKKYYFLFCIIWFGFGAGLLAQEKKQSGNSAPKMVFKELSFDFGDVVQGEIKSHTFKFKNEGEKPLIIYHVLTSCGCTAVEWPKSPVKPRKSGQIKIIFDSKGKAGRQNKVIQVLSNDPGSPARLKITASVLPKKKP
ncbi:MAG: DUF1573 domain-containing protein [Cytophagales bacterium]|nr:DUF1573 domain-containing protein [Cytophagales bacterium]